MSTYLNKFYNQEVLPFLKNIAWACNLKYHEDLRTFLIVGVVYASEYWRWNLYDHPQYPEFSQSIWFRLFDIFWLMMTCTHAFYCATIVHNCVHFAQFRNYHVNTVWHLVLGHTYGWPVSTLIPGHNLSHHKYVQTPLDVHNTTRMRNPINFINALTFVASKSGHIMNQDKQYFRESWKRGNYATALRVLIEAAVFVSVATYLCYLSPSRWVWCVLIPQTVAKFGLQTVNLLQHDGCLVPRECGETVDPYIAEGSQTMATLEKKRKLAEKLAEKERKLNPTPEKGSVSPTPASSTAASSTTGKAPTAGSAFGERVARMVAKKHNNSAERDSDDSDSTEASESEKDKSLWDPDFNFSRDFVGSYVNWWTCNNGYHTIHHLRPSMHWSKYPMMSKKLVEPYQHPELRQKNILTFGINCFFFNNRTTWDGRPYTVSELEPDYDEEWVPLFFKLAKDPLRED